jgi:hypothetical protein
MKTIVVVASFIANTTRRLPEQGYTEFALTVDASYSQERVVAAARQEAKQVIASFGRWPVEAICITYLDFNLCQTTARRNLSQVKD